MRPALGFFAFRMRYIQGFLSQKLKGGGHWHNLSLPGTIYVTAYRCTQRFGGSYPLPRMVRFRFRLRHSIHKHGCSWGQGRGVEALGKEGGDRMMALTVTDVPAE